jgi:hypothetical protein
MTFTPLREHQRRVFWERLGLYSVGELFFVFRRNLSSTAVFAEGRLVKVPFQLFLSSGLLSVAGITSGSAQAEDALIACTDRCDEQQVECEHKAANLGQTLACKDAAAKCYAWCEKQYPTKPGPDDGSKGKDSDNDQKPPDTSTSSNDTAGGH